MQKLITRMLVLWFITYTSYYPALIDESGGEEVSSKLGKRHCSYHVLKMLDVQVCLFLNVNVNISCYQENYSKLLIVEEKHLKSYKKIKM